MKKILVFIVGIIGIFGFVNADGVYHNPVDGLISIVYNDGSNVITFQDKNLGATCYDVSLLCSHGNYYQFGNNFPFIYSPSNYTKINNTVDISSYGPGNYYNSNGSFYRNVDIGNNYDVWGAVTGTPEAMQGPCPSGFHLVDNWQNIQNIFVNYFNISSTSPVGFTSYLLMPLAGYVGYSSSQVGSFSSYGDYWSSSSYTQLSSYFANFDSSNYVNNITDNSYALSVRCQKNISVSPDYSWVRIVGDVIDVVSEISVFYNNSNDFVKVQCNGDNSIFIDGYSIVSNNNTTFTPYFFVDYTDEDNQLLTESYDKSILYLSGALFKKTYTGDNDWILSVQGGISDNSFSGYLPTFDITGGIDEITESGNIFNNFAENSVKFTLSNVPSYIQYVIIIMLLLFVLGFIRKFKRR